MSKRGRLFTRSGFTLLELLAVMSMMALLTTLAVTSYFSAVSGMARRSAVKSVVNTLTLARQRACMEGARINVVFYNELHGYKKDEDGNMTSTEDYLPSFVIVKAMGRISKIALPKIFDEFSDLSVTFQTLDKINSEQGGNVSLNTFPGRLRLYNLTRGGWWMVLPFVDKETNVSLPNSDSIECYYFMCDTAKTHGNAASALVGDVYGVDAGPVGSLPKGFAIDGLDTEDDSFQVCFLPDGSTDTSISDSRSSITLVETRLKSSQPRNAITVDSTGKISYDETWK